MTKRWPLNRASAAPRVEPTAHRDDVLHPNAHGPLETPEAIANEPAPFPSRTGQAVDETGFPDWRHRLTGNLARRSDGRWDPLTWTHPGKRPPESAAD